MIAARNEREIVVSWGDDGAVITNLNNDSDRFVDRVTKKSRSDLRAAEQAKELLGKSSSRIIDSDHPSRRRESDREESESGKEERSIYPLIEKGTGFKDDIQSDKVPKDVGTGKEDIQPDKVPRSDPFHIKGTEVPRSDPFHIKGTGFKVDIQSDKVSKDVGTGEEDILPDKVPRSDPFHINSHGLTRKAAWPEDLQKAIKDVLKTQCVKPESPEFKFEMTMEAAEKNFCVLSKYKKDLGKAIKAQQKSPLGYGSEFRPTEVIKKVFHSHPNWDRMEKILLYGSSWTLEDLDEEEKLSDLKEALEFGNHKGATEKPELLRELVEKDITHGYALVLPLSKITRIPGVLMAPMNIQKQNTIDEHGMIIEKDRLTHDQSYRWSSGTSVNSRVDKEVLLPCMFGGCIKRIINWAVAARRECPGQRILASKIDYKSAYRRCHLNASTAIQTCTQLPDEGLAIVALRLTFGGAPGPYEWGVISETVCDLAMAILQDNNWDPMNLHAPNQELVPKRKILGEEIPFAEGKQLIVDVPVDPRGMVDVYIDNTIGLTVDLPGTDNVTRLERATLLAIHVVARQKHLSEPILREEMAALAKLLAEAGAEEEKTILGWNFDFRQLLVLLPENKFIAWSEAITKIMDEGKATAKDLERNIGRLVHLGMVLSFIHHFLSRLRQLQRRAENRSQ